MENALKQKFIQTKSTRKWKLIESLGFLIPVLIFVFFGLLNSSAWTESTPEKGGILALVLFLLFVTTFFSIPLMLLWRSIFRQVKLKAILRSTFKSVQDLDYYRDKLDGLSPVAISMLTDMSIEPEKDVSAMLLHYQMKGIISIDGNNVQVLRPEDPSLLPSDKLLLQTIIARGGILSADLSSQLSEWKNVAVAEVLGGNYFRSIDAETLKKRTGKACCLGCASLALIPGLIMGVIALIMNSDSVKYVRNILDNLPDNAGNREFMQLITSDGKMAQGVLLMLLFAILFFLLLVWPVIAVARFIAQNSGNERLKRTNEGEELTEYIYGMKNFLHDFSELSEANKEQLILWDDFLIYAVVLEENELILQEIFKRKSLDIDAFQFMGHN
jgi:hypothetical protein